MKNETANNLAPLVIFVYNRPVETKHLIESLLTSKEASESEVYIFSDGPKSQSEEAAVAAVREYVGSISGFRTIRVFNSKVNKGLASSVIAGVTKVLNEHDKVIVLEDDLVCSDDFLEFMNSALDTYQNNSLVWSVSGYNSLNCRDVCVYDVYLAPRASSWGWGTWSDRWDNVDWNLKKESLVINDRFQRNIFNHGGNDLSKMLHLQMLNRIDSWAIRWVYNQFLIGQYTVYPVFSKISNRGIKPGGTHGDCLDSRWDAELNNSKLNLPENIFIERKLLKLFKVKHDLDWLGQLSYLLREFDLYKYFKRFKKFFRN